MMEHALKIQEDNSAFMMSMLGIIVSANTPEMVKTYAFYKYKFHETVKRFLLRIEEYSNPYTNFIFKIIRNSNHLNR